MLSVPWKKDCDFLDFTLRGVNFNMLFKKCLANGNGHRILRLFNGCLCNARASEGSEGFVIKGALRNTMTCFHWPGRPREVTSGKFLTCHRNELICHRGNCPGVFDEDY